MASTRSSLAAMTQASCGSGVSGHRIGRCSVKATAADCCCAVTCSQDLTLRPPSQGVSPFSQRSRLVVSGSSLGSAKVLPLRSRQRVLSNQQQGHDRSPCNHPARHFYRRKYKTALRGCAQRTPETKCL